MNRQQLVDLIVGRELAQYYPKERSRELGAVVLETRNLSGARLSSFSLAVRAGEIVGVTGLLGCGRSELGRLVFGVQQRTAGEVLVDGNTVHFASPVEAVRARIGYVPENRLRDGVHREMSLSDNVNLLRIRQFMRHGFLSARRMAESTRASLTKFLVRPVRPEAIMGTLSGGNQQKAVLAKWMNLEPRLLVLDEPVQGVDIGAKSDVYAIIAEAADHGAAVLMLGSEIDDMAELCDRVIVLRNGVAVAELAGESLTAKRLSAVMYEEVRA